MFLFKTLNIMKLEENNVIKEKKNIFFTNLNKEKLKYLTKKIGIKLGKDFMKFIWKIIEVVIFFACFCLFLNWSNNSLLITEDVYINEEIPDSFNGFKILQLSDFNNKKSISKDLIKNTKEINPDIIVITGDYINAERSTEYNIDYSFIEELIKEYPIYFVTGEQEQDCLFYDKFKIRMEKLGVKILDNKTVEISKKEKKINLIGLDDSSFFFENLTAFNNKLKELNVNSNFSILLSHRPELIDIYTENNIPLVLSGHALGGQVNLPFVGSLYSSNQGFYPNYTKGFYIQENTSIYVSRGIGNNFIPIRLFNRPEINVITLKKG